MTGPVLTTERLTLRLPEAGDLEGWIALLGDEEAARYIGGQAPPTIAWRALCSSRGAWDLFGFGMFSVVEAATGSWIGRIGPLRPAGWPGDEIGWGLLRSAWGRGYATEAATAAMAWARDALGWREVIHVIHPDNAPSRSVARRLGSRPLRLGRLPPPFNAEEMEIWGQTLSPR